MSYFRTLGSADQVSCPNFSSCTSKNRLTTSQQDSDYEEPPHKRTPKSQKSVDVLRSLHIFDSKTNPQKINLLNHKEINHLSSQLSSLHFNPEPPDATKDEESTEFVITFGEGPFLQPEPEPKELQITAESSSDLKSKEPSEFVITFGEGPFLQPEPEPRQLQINAEASSNLKNKESSEFVITFGEAPFFQAESELEGFQITFGESSSSDSSKKIRKIETLYDVNSEDLLPSNSLFQMTFKTKISVLGVFGYSCEALTLFRKFEYLVTSSDRTFQMENYDFCVIYRGTKRQETKKEIHSIPVQTLQDRVWSISMPECNLKNFNVLASIRYKLKEASRFRDWEIFSNIKVHSAIKAKYVRKLTAQLAAFQSKPSISSFQIVGQKSKQHIHSNLRPYFDLTAFEENVASVDENSLKMFKNAEGIRALIVTDFILQFPYPFKKLNENKILKIFDLLKNIVRKPAKNYLDFNHPICSFQDYLVKNPFKFIDNPIFHKRVILPSSVKANGMLCNFIDPVRLSSHLKNRISPLDAWNQKSLKVSTIKAALKGKSVLKPDQIDRFIQRYMPSSKQYCPSILIELIGILEKELHMSIRSLLDPCAGYGGRLAGACATLDYYMGVDPCSALHPKYQEIYQFLRSNGKTDTKIEMVQEPFEKVNLDPYLDKLFGKDRLDTPFDAVVTCPPYFALEIYSEEETQSVKNYPTLEGWIKHFLQPLIDKSSRYLKPGGILAINIRDCKTFKNPDEEYKICDPMNHYCLSCPDLEWLGVITVSGGAGIPTFAHQPQGPLEPKISKYEENVRNQSLDFIWIYRKIENPSTKASIEP